MYKIDLHLKQYSKALSHLAMIADDHREECIALVTSQRLYTEALSLFSPSTEMHKVQINFIV